MADLHPGWRIRLAALVLSSVSIAACGSFSGPTSTAGASSGAPSGSPVADGCRSMTIEQASEALGAAMDTATPLTDAVGCTYEIQGSPTVIAFQFTDQAHWTEAHTGTYTSIDLGDEAIYTTDADTGFTVFNVRQGSTYLSVVVNVEPGGAKTALDVGTAVVGYVLP
jgi:hypothetical protein